MVSTRQFTWTAAGKPVTLGLDEAGEGRTVLLLPALSSISTRGEMAGLIAELSPYFHTVAVDWPGFGDGPRPNIDWSPDLLSDYLEYVIREIAPSPYAVIAAGHAATYVYDYLAARPGAVERIVSIAPTWRGPFPTVAGGQKPWFAWLRRAVDAPILGHLIYAINLSKPVMARMVGGHVYSDPTWLKDEALAQKRAVTRGEGARHASVRFVTGALDRVESRDAFLDLARAVKVPHLVIYGEETPRRSRAEMDALAALPEVEGAIFRKGKLSFHEEFPFKAGQATLMFLLKKRDAEGQGAETEPVEAS